MSLKNILNNALNKDESLNILYLGYDGYFENLMGLLPHKFYALRKFLTSNITSKFLPKNMEMIDNIGDLPKNVNINLVMSNSRTYGIRNICRSLHVPCVYVDHEPPKSENPQYIASSYKSLPKKTTLIYTSKNIADSWLYYEEEVNPFPYLCIPYCILKDIPKPDKREKGPLLLLNNLSTIKDRSKFAGCDVVDIGDYAFSDLLELISRYNYVITNTEENHKVPIITELVAKSCGCSIITNYTKYKEDLFHSNKVNAYMYRDFSEVNKIIDHINVEAERKVPINTYLEQDRFMYNWNDILMAAKSGVYRA